MLATNMRRMRKNNLGIRIAGSSCRLQLLLLLLSLLLIYFIEKNSSYNLCLDN